MPGDETQTVGGFLEQGASRLRSGQRGSRRQAAEQQRRPHERRRVDGQESDRADGDEEHSTERRREQLRPLRCRLHESVRRDQIFLGDVCRQHGVAGGVEEERRDGERRPHDDHHWHGGVSARDEHRQERDERGTYEIGADHHTAAIESVDDCAREDPQRQRRDQVRDAEDHEGLWSAAEGLEHEPGDRDRVEPITDDRSGVCQPEPAEVGDGEDPPPGWDEASHEAAKRSRGSAHPIRK